MIPGSVAYVLVDIDAGFSPSLLAQMTPGLQAQIREDFAPEWGAGDADTVAAQTPSQVLAAELPNVLVQLHGKAPADKQDALAYHTRTPDGGRIIPVFRDLLERYGVSLSSTVSHELLEDRADPDLTACVQLPDGRIAALEICDQVEATSYQKLGVEVSNFNTRANFAPRPDGKPEKYDFLGKLTASFQVLDGGYAQVYDPRSGWTQLSTGMHAYRAHMHRLGLSRGARRAMLGRVPWWRRLLRWL